MKVLHLHNRYRVRGGEDIAVDATVEMLRQAGVEVHLEARESHELVDSRLARFGAFFSGIYSRASRAHVFALLKDLAPDIVHVHNLLPLHSPSVLLACRDRGIPVVMTCHNCRLLCPTGSFSRKGRPCELCLGGREYHCLLTNCRGRLLESAAYAARNVVHRKLRLYTDHVSLFLTTSGALRDKLVQGGFDPRRLRVVPNSVDVPDETTDPAQGGYFAYAGRLAPGKGVETLLEAVRVTGYPTRFAGSVDRLSFADQDAPPEARFLGRLTPEQMGAFYRHARCVVVPSNNSEAFGLVAAEAMGHGLPVIASRVGGLPEVVDDERTGFLIAPGDASELARKMERLWNDADLCRRFGAAGREKVLREYSRQVYRERLVSVYRDVVAAASKARVARAGVAAREESESRV